MKLPVILPLQKWVEFYQLTDPFLLAQMVRAKLPVTETQEEAPG